MVASVDCSKSTFIKVLVLLVVSSVATIPSSAFGLAQTSWSTINSRSGSECSHHHHLKNLKLSSDRYNNKYRLSSSRLFFGLNTIEKQEEQYLQSAAAENHPVAALLPESTVHVIVYDPNTEQEQVHFTEYPPQSGSFCLLAFESSLECQHFAELIQVGVPGDVDTVATPYTLEQMELFCQDMNVALYLVPDS